MIKMIGHGGGGPDTSVPQCPVCFAFGGGGHGGYCPNATPAGPKPPEDWVTEPPPGYIRPAG